MNSDALVSNRKAWLLLADTPASISPLPTTMPASLMALAKLDEPKKKSSGKTVSSVLMSCTKNLLREIPLTCLTAEPTTKPLLLMSVAVLDVYV